MQECEWKFFGSKESVNSAFEELSSKSIPKKLKKRKFYRDTPAWDIFGLSHYFRYQIYNQDHDRLTDEKTIQKKIKSGKAHFRGTLKSDGSSCEKQGLIRLENKTQMMRQPNHLMDILDVGTRSLFSHIAHHPLLDVFVTKEKRKTAIVAADPEDPSAFVKLERIKAKFILDDDREAIVYLLEIENYENTCSDDQIEKFKNMLDNDPALCCIKHTMADIGYSLACQTDVQRDLMGERYVDVHSIPGAVVSGQAVQEVLPVCEAA